MIPSIIAPCTNLPINIASGWLWCGCILVTKKDAVANIHKGKKQKHLHISHFPTPSMHGLWTHVSFFLFFGFCFSSDVWWHVGQAAPCHSHLEWVWNVPHRRPHMWRLHVQRPHGGYHHAQLLCHWMWVGYVFWAAPQKKIKFFCRKNVSFLFFTRCWMFGDYVKSIKASEHFIYFQKNGLVYNTSGGEILSMLITLTSYKDHMSKMSMLDM